VKQVIEKAHKSLKLGGVFAFSLKQGEGSEWSQHKLNSDRYFKYWSEPELKALLDETNFEDFELSRRTSPRDKWFQIIVKK
jgi:predicted TPR repeat methyltransferase